MLDFKMYETELGNYVWKTLLIRFWSNPQVGTVTHQTTAFQL